MNVVLKDWLFDVELTFEHDDLIPTISYGPLGDDVYELCKIHDHWGLEDHEGSEHTLNGKSFPLERHFIFYNRKYKSFHRALAYTDGLVVVSQWFAVSKDADRNPVVDAINKQFNGEGLTSITLKIEDDFEFSQVFGDGSFVYAYYFGSLTSPPCSEIVSWIVSLKVREILPEQMQIFQELLGRNHLICAPNYRKVQDLNGRHVFVAKTA